MNTHTALTLALALAWASALQAMPAGYIAYNLGRGRPNAVNDFGVAVGVFEASRGGFSFDPADGRVIDLHAGGGSTPTDINNLGTIVGPNFYIVGGTLLNPAPLSPYAVNNHGTMAGVHVSTGRACIDTGGILTDLGTLPGMNSWARAINDADTVVGYDETGQAFVWSNGEIIHLGTLGGASSRAAAINNSGTIVGGSQNALSETRIFTYSNGTMTDLGPGWADDINDAGVIVGESQGHAFCYEAGQIVDLSPYLSSIGSGASFATGINDRGDIVGGVYYSLGYSIGFYLQAIPEPSAAMLLAIGLGWVMAGRRHHSRSAKPEYTPHPHDGVE